MKVSSMLRLNSLTSSQKFLLNKDKLIVGSAPHCDIYINDDTVSHYHAIINIGDEYCEVIDLGSTNGTMINNSKVQKSIINANDQISFGQSLFNICEYIPKAFETFITLDSSIKLMDQSPEVLLTPTNVEDLVLIDGEYCDIKIANTHSNLSSMDDYAKVLSSVEIEAFEDLDHIAHNKDNEVEDEKEIHTHYESSSLKITHLIGGVIDSIDYKDLKNEQSICVKKAIKCIYKSNIDELFISLFDLKINKLGSDVELQDEDYIEKNAIYTIKSEHSQILLEVIKTPPKTKKTSFFMRDTEFYKQTAKAGGAFLSLLLILLFVDITPPPEETKEMVVIYKPQKQDNSKSSQARQGEKLKLTEAKEQIPKKSISKIKPNKVKNIAKSKPIDKPQPKKVMPKLKLSSKLSSYLSDTSNIPNATRKSSATRAPASVANTNSALNGQSSNLLKSKGKTHNIQGGLKFAKGLGGLSAKGDINTIEIPSKTVILGSIDPDLLRKIIREYLPQFRYCYQQELEKKESLEGIIDLNFRINKNGAVSNIDVKSQSANFTNGGTNCMAKVLKLINFPKPKGGGLVDVRQPLNFQSEKGKI